LSLLSRDDDDDGDDSTSDMETLNKHSSHINISFQYALQSSHISKIHSDGRTTTAKECSSRKASATLTNSDERVACEFRMFPNSLLFLVKRETFAGSLEYSPVFIDRISTHNSQMM
jgi:hypothetical protein